MNLVTLTMHSPSHASVTVDARVKKNNNWIAESMGAGGARGKRKKERDAGREGGSMASSSIGVECCESSFSNHEGSTGGDHRGRLSLVFPCEVKFQIDDQEW
jgi:hypothetical protein